MNPFVRTSDGLRVMLTETERMLLVRLADDMQTLLLGPERRETSPSVDPEAPFRASRWNEGDPALARLLPDAYPNDPEASAEFRRFTQDELLERKTSQQRTVARLFDGEADRGSDDAVLTPADSLALLRALGDMRLTLAERLGIREDGDDGMSVPGNEFTANVYAWLGYLQGSLVEALDA